MLALISHVCHGHSSAVHGLRFEVSYPTFKIFYRNIAAIQNQMLRARWWEQDPIHMMGIFLWNRCLHMLPALALGTHGGRVSPSLAAPNPRHGARLSKGAPDKPPLLSCLTLLFYRGKGVKPTFKEETTREIKAKEGG